MSPQRKKSKDHCCVPQCTSNRRKDEKISFHHFPSGKNSIQARKEWIHKLRIGKTVSKSMLVCSKHFTSNDYFFPGIECKKRYLKKTAIPSSNLPKLSTFNPEKEKRKQIMQIERRTRAQNRQAFIKTINNECENKAAANQKEINNYLMDCECHEEDIDIYQPQERENEREIAEILLDLAKTPIKMNKAVQVNTGDMGSKFTNFLTENNINKITGLPSIELLNGLIKCFEQFKHSTSKHTFSVKERIVLTMMKLKHNTTNSFLSSLFNCSLSTCANIISETTGILAVILSSTVYIPSKEEIMQNMPQHFAKYKSVRLVLDCTEISVAQPNCLNCSINTYSFYKKNNTVKYLIAVTPAGLVSFISKGYGGRASDKAIFQQSGLIHELIPMSDSIMVDKGFLIDDICDQNFISLIRPPFKKAKMQLSKDDAQKTHQIASARVHVETVIQRFKIFKILSTRISWNMVPLIDNIMMIIAGLTNLSPPILKDEKFL